ncbi:cinnamycin family lantibiotic [Parafrankia sp. EUN1f]|uniref:cinnamycin family lantibiotic n=1 Tax=Parafrankia sp. EUN1f TaxID=102897 RepID=UPI0001C46CA9|nr:cinnamycin family lantibiotic [Parafrankia sp. EUN1f]EFC80455.1 hypothetical protein FrEUN1fDRAFT_6431 [Parafrankia sp. EUN1f]
MITSASKISPDLDEVLYQAVVDEEFRALVLADPKAFGIGAEMALPDAVEPQSQAILEFGTIAGRDCKTTCSSGPITIVCDGNTK